jgi:hypothetical protein
MIDEGKPRSNAQHNCYLFEGSRRGGHQPGLQI